MSVGVFDWVAAFHFNGLKMLFSLGSFLLV